MKIRVRRCQQSLKRRIVIWIAVSIAGIGLSIGASANSCIQDGLSSAGAGAVSQLAKGVSKTGYEVELPISGFIPFISTQSGTLAEIVPEANAQAIAILPILKTTPPSQIPIGSLSFEARGRLIEEVLFPHIAKIKKPIRFGRPVNNAYIERAIPGLTIDRKAIAKAIGSELAAEMQPYVQFADPENVLGSGLEIHAISTRDFSNFRKDVGTMLAQTKTTDFSLHAHLVGSVPLKALKAAPLRMGAYLAFESARANVTAEMFTIVVGRTPISDVAGGAFGALGTREIRGVMSQYIAIGEGTQAGLPHDFAKKGWVGIRGHGVYHEDAPLSHENIPDLDWGWEFRSFDFHANPGLQDGLVTGLRKQHDTLAALDTPPASYNHWFDARKHSLAETPKHLWSEFVNTFHYNQPWPEFAETLPPGHSREAAMLFAERYARREHASSSYHVTGNQLDSHHEIKMLFFDWSNSPYGQMFPESTRRFDSMKAQAIDRILQSREKPEEVVRDILIKSGLFEDLYHAIDAAPAPR